MVFGKPAIDDQGNPIFLNDTIASALCQINSGNAAKNMSIALRLHDKGEVELDESDLEFFKSSIKKINNLTDLVIYEVEKEIEAQIK